VNFANGQTNKTLVPYMYEHGNEERSAVPVAVKTGRRCHAAKAESAHKKLQPSVLGFE
jgi:hypothetical protein